MRLNYSIGNLARDKSWHTVETKANTRPYDRVVRPMTP
jgi:hypothetical protein